MVRDFGSLFERIGRLVLIIVMVVVNVTLTESFTSKIQKMVEPRFNLLKVRLVEDGSTTG